MKKEENNFLIGAGILGGITLLGIVIWQFSKSKKTTLELAKNNDTKNVVNTSNINNITQSNKELDEVKILQTNLNKLLGVNMVVDGIYGNQTKNYAQKYFSDNFGIIDSSNFSIQKMVDMTNSQIMNGKNEDGYYDRNGVWNTITREAIEYHTYNSTQYQVQSNEEWFESFFGK